MERLERRMPRTLSYTLFKQTERANGSQKRVLRDSTKVAIGIALSLGLGVGLAVAFKYSVLPKGSFNWAYAGDIAVGTTLAGAVITAIAIKAWNRGTSWRDERRVIQAARRTLGRGKPSPEPRISKGESVEELKAEDWDRILDPEDAVPVLKEGRKETENLDTAGWKELLLPSDELAAKEAAPTSSSEEVSESAEGLSSFLGEPKTGLFTRIGRSVRRIFGRPTKLQAPPPTEHPTPPTDTSPSTASPAEEITPVWLQEPLPTRVIEKKDNKGQTWQVVQEQSEDGSWKDVDGIPLSGKTGGDT